MGKLVSTLSKRIHKNLVNLQGESFEKVTLSIGKHSWLENGPRIEEVFPIETWGIFHCFNAQLGPENGPLEE